MDQHPIEIIRIVRRMRGGSQSHLVEGQDGNFYVAKFRGNPQGSRTLINECFAHQLFRHFGITTPALRVLRLPAAVSEHAFFTCGGARAAVEPGFHLGSQCPVNPGEHTIFDFLPSPVLHRVVNRNDFVEALVLDQFLAHAGTRQAIFVREKQGHGTGGMRAYLIDHGSTLGGHTWTLPNDSSRSLYWDQTVYWLCPLRSGCEQMLDRMAALRKEDLYRFGQEIPRLWFAPGDDAEWAKLLHLLEARRARLSQMVLDQVEQLQLRRQRKLGLANSLVPTGRDHHLLEREPLLLESVRMTR